MEQDKSDSAFSIWIVVPTYNERDNITELSVRTLKTIPTANLLIVDDSSPDGTAEIVKKMHYEDGRIHLLVRTVKSGLGSAYRDGFQYALDRGAAVLVEMDADLSHSPEELPLLLAAVRCGASLAIGSRYVPGGNPGGLTRFRLRLSQFGNRYAAFMLGLGIVDATSGFRAYQSAAVKSIDLQAIRADGYGFQIEMAYRVFQQGGALVEVPIQFLERRAGTSKMSLHIVVEAMWLCTVLGISRIFKRSGSRVKDRGKDTVIDLRDVRTPQGDQA